MMSLRVPPWASMMSAVLVGYGFTRQSDPTVAHSAMQVAVLSMLGAATSRKVHRITRPNALGRQEFLHVSTSNVAHIDGTRSCKHSWTGHVVTLATAALALLPVWAVPMMAHDVHARAQSMCMSCIMLACVRRRFNQMLVLLVCLVMVFSCPVDIRMKFWTAPAACVLGLGWFFSSFGTPTQSTLAVLVLRIALPHEANASSVNLDWAAAAVLVRPCDAWLVGVSTALSLISTPA